MKRSISTYHLPNRKTMTINDTNTTINTNFKLLQIPKLVYPYTFWILKIYNMSQRNNTNLKKRNESPMIGEKRLTSGAYRKTYKL